ncbi:hypothetical protein ANOM_005288 [Aspergillus nomiae NRRL 13137]|uniref:Uncharacterized protein n=1 Tax=Aspergillus nomiae NRRL (strain ATCC 15546 / NRRL 13137 / CBS 260.88 / M93) TaxID=1509407 RepID=A0A0L1J5T2_ASPN3|nr:uncharacterized protein ANOM_005288 [Aspergillus nomiae NRRL 13137]KNG87097.1 hypothetical protein ANOM_005288 [Aspergillus nomiae NRRL 13137]
MQLSTFATILGLVCAAIAAPQGHEGGDDHSHGGEHPAVERFCCAYNTYPPGATYKPSGSQNPMGCAKTNGACGVDFPVPWTCPVPPAIAIGSIFDTLGDTIANAVPI